MVRQQIYESDSRLSSDQAGRPRLAAFQFDARIALPVTRRAEPVPVGGTRSGPVGQDFVRLDDLFGRAGKIEFEFSSAAGDMDLDGIQAAVLHPEAELFVDFPETVLLEAIAHG
jgi:hypothetical protein